MNYINYCLLFHSNWNNWYNSHNWYNKAAMSCSMLQCAFNPHLLLLHIAGPAQSPRIDQPHPASVPSDSPEPSRRWPGAPAKSLLSGAEWFRCHWQELLAVCPGYFQRGWCIELVSCSWARIGPGNQQITASLKWINKYTKNKCHYIFNWYNYHS